MSGLLLAASVVVAVTALLHAVLGELLIIRHLARLDGLPPLLGRHDLPRQTLRFTWHLPSILALALAAILGRYASLAVLGDGERFVVAAIAVSLLACAAVIIVITRGRHPGWTAFLAAAALCGLAMR